MIRRSVSIHDLRAVVDEERYELYLANPVCHSLLVHINDRQSVLIGKADAELAPVDALADVIDDAVQGETASTTQAARDVMGFVEEVVQYLLAGHHYEPLRRIAGTIGKAEIPCNRYYFYRKIEGPLFDAIDSGESVVLAITAETRRLARSLVERYNHEDRRRRIFVWTTGSDLFEIQREGGETRYLTPGDPANYRVRYNVRRLSDELGADCSDDDKAEARKGLEDEGFRVFADGALRLWIRHPQEFDRLMDVEVVADDLSLPSDDDLPTDEIKHVCEMAAQDYLRSKIKERDSLPKATSAFEDEFLFAKVLRFITERRIKNALYILQDAHQYLAATGMLDRFANRTASTLKDANIRLRRAKTGTQIVALAADFKPPSDLTTEVKKIELNLPSRRELLAEYRRRLHSDIARWNGTTPEELDPLATSDDLVRIADSAAGMTLMEAVDAVRPLLAVGNVRPEDVMAAIQDAKKSAVKRNPALELVDTHSVQQLDLGGMDRFLGWLESRKKVFDQPDKARAVGIERPPRGVLLLGIPGTGKSLAAKLIARDWKLPLVRLDMGAVQDKFVGESEKNIREALKIVEAMSPCILWIDEIDKGVAQDDGAHAHSTTLNVRATLLTWLQETRVPAFVVATANRFNALPPELTRAGRFDARFFLGCPDADGRKQILNIHLNARGIGMDVDDLKPVIDLTQGFTGAELEQIVLDALYAAFNRDEKMTLNDLVAAASQSTPLIRAVGKGLDEVWNLIEQGRVLPASDSLLSRTQLAKLIDPDLFSPMYCRQENISGWDRQASKGARMLMRDPLQGSSAAILETGDDEWAFVQTNVRFEPADQHHWKFLDKISTIAANGVLDTLVTQYGVEAILFENRERMRQFAEDSVLGAYAELYRPAALDEASEMSD